MVVFGSRLFGKVEEVPGVFHVATRFFHLNFVPLFPTGSWVVLHGTEKSGLMSTSWRGIELEHTRWSSVGMAWLRFGLVVAMLVLGVYGLVELGKRGPAGLALGLAMAAGCLVALIASYRISRATPESLAALARDANVPAELVRQAQAALRGAKGPGQLVR